MEFIMKKLLFAAVSLDIGGIETSLLTLLNELANEKENGQYKYEITLVLEKKQGVFLESLNKRISVIEFRPSNIKFVPIRKFINFIKQTKFKIKYKSKFDFAAAYATYSLPASFVARIASENCALWVHSEYMSMFNNNKLEYIKFFKGVSADKFRKIIFVSNNAKKIFEKVFSEEKELTNKAIVINNLIDYKKIIKKAEEQLENMEKSDVYTFLNVSRHTEEDKKISKIIEAAKKLKENDNKFRILLVGDGKDSNKYKNLVKEYNLEQNIIFLGKKENPYPYFKIANSFILTSEYEGFPVVYLECMILGLAIITTDVSDSKDIINNKYGIVVDKDVNSIFKGMKKAIEFGLNINENFNYEEYNKEIIRKLTNLIE